MRSILDSIPSDDFARADHDGHHDYLPLPAYRKRAAIVAPTAAALTGSCHGLIASMAGRGHKVFAFAPELSNRDLRQLAHMGSEAYSLPPQPDKYRRMRELSTLLGDTRPDIVLVQSVQSGAASVAAAKIARSPQVVTVVPGLGPAFMEGADRSAWGERQAMKAVYRAVFTWSDAIVFHSPHDRKYLEDRHLLPKSRMYLSVGGWGEDLSRNAQQPLPPFDRGAIFMMAAPLDWYQGIKEYCEAAQAIRAKTRRAHFFLASAPGEAAASIAAADLNQYRDAVQYIGPVDDAASVIARCHAVVAPSYGHEAPRSLYQALSAGRPIITTDTRSCRGFVQQGRNGYRVAVRDTGSLTRAMTQLLQRPDLFPVMAEESRRMALRLYDVNNVNSVILEALGL